MWIPRWIRCGRKSGSWRFNPDLREPVRLLMRGKSYPVLMDLGKVLEDLRRELHQVDEAILSLERMVIGAGKRRGRPPAWIVAAREAPVKKRGRPPGSKNRKGIREAQ